MNVTYSEVFDAKMILRICTECECRTDAVSSGLIKI